MGLTRDEFFALAVAIGFAAAAAAFSALGFPLPSLDAVVREPLTAAARVAVAWLPVLLFSACLRPCGREARRGPALLAALAFAAGVVLFAGIGADMSHALHPATLDAAARKLDGAFGFAAGLRAAELARDVPGLAGLLLWTPELVALGFAALYGRQLRDGRRPPAHLLSLAAAFALAAALAPHLAPVAGPGAAAARNAFPALEVVAALLLWCNVRLVLGPVGRAAALILLALTALGALAGGRHYLADLVAAAPFALALQSGGMRVTVGGAGRRREALVLGLGLWLFWAALLRFGTLPDSGSGVLPLSALATLAVCALAWSRLHPFASWGEDQAVPAPDHPAERGYLRRMAWMFFVSGFIGLVYEVVFSRQLALVFGGMASATYTVLAVYLGGMALGAWIGGILASRGWHALRTYAACEAAIGLYCVTTPAVLAAVRAAYVWLGEGLPPDAAVLLAARVALGALALLPPTVLMGITLPVLGSELERRGMGLGSAVGRLYGANTLGAALGSLVAGYALLPLLGIRASILLAAGGGLGVALVALATRALPPKASLGDHDHARERISERLRRATLLSLFLTGVVTLVMEVEYMHLLAVVAGNSSYAFSLMLFALLVGLGVGGELGPRLLRSPVPPARWLARALAALAALLLAGVFAWNGMPDVFAAYEGFAFRPGFGAREFIRGVVCWLMMFPPAVLIGMAYPLAMNLAGSGPSSAARARRLGGAVALNTLGNIVGALLGGFVLLPVLGALASVQLAAGLLLASALLLWWGDGRLKSAEAGTAALGVLALFAVQPAALDYDRLSKGANVYFANRNWGKVIAHAESLDGGLTLVTSARIGAEPVKILLTNGKFQGNDVMHGEMRAQLGFAMAPLFHLSGRDSALVIGYGTGVTARTLREAGYRSLEVVDLSRDIVSLADRHFGKVNDGVSSRPGVGTRCTDGRNFLLLTSGMYDLISMEVSSIWFAGAASLYSREFYRLAAGRLRPDGVLQQWVQLHHITPRDIAVILGSLRAEFPYVWFYVIGDQGVIVARKTPGRIAMPAVPEKLVALMDRVHLTADEIRGSLKLGPDGVDRLLAAQGVPPEKLLSTDDNLFLEYSTPRGNALDGARSYTENLAFVAGFADGLGTGR